MDEGYRLVVESCGCSVLCPALAGVQRKDLYASTNFWSFVPATSKTPHHYSTNSELTGILSWYGSLMRRESRSTICRHRSHPALNSRFYGPHGRILKGFAFFVPFFLSF